VAEVVIAEKENVLTIVKVMVKEGEEMIVEMEILKDVKTVEKEETKTVMMTEPVEKEEVMDEEVVMVKAVLHPQTKEKEKAPHSKGEDQDVIKCI
jgi:hypothetical protein